ncbi:MAG: DUF983 domain-containing protein [Leptospiraceae bacterium]|nr:DUF983 domain-containing protein [Leptospiraceae bacterium]
MPANCPHCDLKYNMEAGFWYGAMYITYLVGTMLLAPLMLLMNYLADPGFFENLALFAILLIVLIPIMFRYSRVIWIHIFVSYDPDARGESAD